MHKTNDNNTKDNNDDKQLTGEAIEAVMNLFFVQSTTQSLLVVSLENSLRNFIAK